MKVTVTGIDEVLAELEKVKHIDEALKEACLELVEEASKIVESVYSLRGAEGNDDYSITIEELPNGYQLTASGADVGFLEFGAGAFTSADEFAQEVGFDVSPGSWSSTHTHRGEGNPNVRYYSKNGFWWWHNIRFTGLTPTRGMQRALDDIRQRMDAVVREKVEKWIDG